MEEWRDIAGFEGAYQVSDLGRVRSLDRVIARGDGRTQIIKGRIKALKTNQDGYRVVVLFHNGTETKTKVHRLVAETFIPNPNSLPVVDHISGDLSDNSKLALRWASLSTNGRNRHRTVAISGVLGVTYRPSFKSPYHATIRDAAGRQRHLGSFRTLEQAAACRAEHERKYRL